MRRVEAAIVCAGASVLLAGCGGGAEPAPTPAEPPIHPAGTCPAQDRNAEVLCPDNGCCPGFAATGGKEFACPTADPTDYDTCGGEGGHERLVNALLAALTRKEKYKFTRGVGWENSYDPLKGYYIGNVALGLPYGIPSQNMQDSGSGFRNDRLTKESVNEGAKFAYEVEQVQSFPCHLAIASSWGEDEMLRFGTALGKEFRKRGANVLLGPAVNVHRVPRNGRNAEYMSGESPYLGAKLVKHYVRGVQSEKVLCSAKHFINNNQEGCRATSNSIVDKRTRFELYYPPFEATVQAGVAAQMCGYNYVNYYPNCGSKEILVDDLKGTLNFKGWVQSDWWATYQFNFTKAGIDQEMPGTGTPDGRVPARFTDANLDTLTEETVNNMVRPQLHMMTKFGLLVPSDDTCVPGPEGTCMEKHYNFVSKTTASEALSKELATKAITLLRNEQVSGQPAESKSLPLSKTGQKILLLGAACDLPGDVHKQTEWWRTSNYYHIGGSGKIITKKPISILQGINDICSATPNYDCKYAFLREDDVTKAKAMITEFAPTTVILCGGVTASEEEDRKDLKIDQEDFVMGVVNDLDATINKIVLTMTAGTITMPWIEKVDAMLNVFLPGKYAGPAFADTLFGISNPSAKTPIFYPKEEAGTIEPCFCSPGFAIDDCNYTEKLNIAWYSKEASTILFPFGFGLSYTTFAYDNFQQTITKADIDERCTNQDLERGETIACISADVTNSGDVDGVEIAQLYLGYPEGAGEPPKLLRGFQRTQKLTAAGKETVAFPLVERDLQVYTEGKGWERPSGTFKIYVGKSASDDDEVWTADLALAPTSLTVNV